MGVEWACVGSQTTVDRLGMDGKGQAGLSEHLEGSVSACKDGGQWFRGDAVPVGGETGSVGKTRDR
jgi:hypothetical protein